ncbi:isoprenoid synthase domain-containing protein [Mycena galopus ATCC 62051]|nr:isoprenoid synthase domain-containing protein [Mycena galopus ATCC 62051]
MTAVLELPDIHKRWPFPVAYNRWEDTVSVETLAWIESLSILSDFQMEKFRAINFCSFASMAYAYLTDVHHFRVACDMVNLLFVLDDITDELSAQEVGYIAEISLAAFRNRQTPRPLGEHPAGEMHRSFSERLHLIANPQIFDRFLVNYELYLKAVADEANERDHKRIRSSLDSYLTLRRETGAVRISFDLLLIPEEIPSDILRDSRLARVENLGFDIVCVGNDILSFNVEQARGDTHNAVIVVMRERELSIQEAMDFVGQWYQQKIEDFYTAMQDLPPCPSVAIRNRVKMYFAAIANWITSNYEWSLRSGRYFPDGENPLESGWVVPLLQSTQP